VTLRHSYIYLVMQSLSNMFAVPDPNKTQHSICAIKPAPSGRHSCSKREKKLR
jgi:hypothetical protein